MFWVNLLIWPFVSWYFLEICPSAPSQQPLTIAVLYNRL